MDFFMDSMSKFVDDASPYALACVSAVQELLDVTITSEMGDQQCCICTNSILIGKKGKQMPYGHLHHRDCLLSWLEINETCPYCRYDLGTDDYPYEIKKKALKFINKATENLFILQV